MSEHDRTAILAITMAAVLTGCAAAPQIDYSAYIQDRIKVRCGNGCMAIIPKGGCRNNKACLNSVQTCLDRFQACTDPMLGVRVHTITFANGEKYRIRNYAGSDGPETTVKRVE